MRLLFVVNDLMDGGAGRVCSILANAWNSRGHQLTVLTTDDGTSPDAYWLNKGISRGYLALRSSSSSSLEAILKNFKRVGVLRRTLRMHKPELVISFLDVTNILTILATRGMGVPVIVSERTDPNLRRLASGWRVLRLLCYHCAEAVVCQTKTALDFFPFRVRVRGRVIANPVVCPENSNSERKEDSRTIVSLGSLRPEKGYDLLLRSFAELAAHHKDWSLLVWGEGNSRRELEALTARLGLQDKVRFPGRTNDPYQKLQEAGIFVLPSRVEGFPNALCEAMAMGLPAVASDVGAIPEIIRPGVDGLIFPRGDVRSLTLNLKKLVVDPAERKRLGKNAKQIVERFSLEKAIDQWEDLIESCLHDKSHRPEATMSKRKWLVNSSN